MALWAAQVWLSLTPLLNIADEFFAGCAGGATIGYKNKTTTASVFLDSF